MPRGPVRVPAPPDGEAGGEAPAPPAPAVEEPPAFSVGDVDRLFAAIDKDGSGQIEYKELHAMLRQGLGVTLHKPLQAGAKGEIAVEAKNKNALRSGGGGGGHGAGGAASPSHTAADEALSAPTLSRRIIMPFMMTCTVLRIADA